MSKKYIRLSERILDELDKIDTCLLRAFRGWRDFQDSNNELFLDSVALSFQGIYNGLEIIFDLIAREVDGERPSGENWHQLLLIQMSSGIEGKRPAVISIEVLQILSDFRGLRHVVRHVYPFELEVELIAKTMEIAEPTFAQIKLELLAFADFLQAIANRN